MATQLPGSSLGAYAAHRGCSKQAVHAAVQRGRLQRSVERFDGVPRIVDFALADREWNGNTLSHMRPYAVQDRDKRRRVPLEYGQRVAVHGDPVPIDEMEVRIDEDVIEVFVSCAPLPDHVDDKSFSDYTFPLSVEGARWLAGELLRCTDQLAASAAAAPNEDATRG
jgi:hypothetical protein